MIICDALIRYAEQYREMDRSIPMWIIAVLKPGSPVAGYDPIHLDNLLARAVVNEATRGSGLADNNEAYELPIPLQCFWRSEEGFPLWASTVFSPVGEHGADTVYWHKRSISGRWTGTKSGVLNIKTVAGRWMERRVPVPAIVANAWEAWCIGNPNEVARLLKGIRFLGKRRSVGFGEIDHWDIVPAEIESLLISDGRLTRPVPLAAAEVLGANLPEDSLALVGWTPPQWKPSLFSPGWWAGSVVRGG